MRNPRATQEVLGFKHAYKNLFLIPKSRMRKGAPVATKMGPQRSAGFAMSRLNPKKVMGTVGLTNQLIIIPII